MDSSAETPAPEAVSLPVKFPRVAIQFCTQCKWMLRAAYFAQELMSTFGTALGEVALQPATGGIFRVTMETEAATTSTSTGNVVLWDRTVDGGFPETKELKRRVRDVIAPGRDLGHVDRAAAKATEAAEAAEAKAAETKAAAKAGKVVETVCQDCQDCQDQ